MTPAGRLLVAVALAFCSAPSATAKEGLGLYLWELGEQAVSRQSLGDAPVRIELGYREPAGAAELLLRHASMDIVAIGEESVTVRVGEAETLLSAPDARDTEASFVIDYDEAPVASLVASRQDLGGSTPTPEALRRFVAGHISDKTYVRSYDIASRVAETGSGDCTEHAFLLAALARANGYPARVVFGLLLVGSDDSVRSFGHAWTEVHADGQWRMLDATLPVAGTDGPWLRYVPIMPLLNEGPGYMMSVIELANVWPRSVRLVETPSTGDP